jgi:hypothetical protein
MSNQVSNIHNPLNIPDILENIFEYLPTETLVRLTYVNRMWRSEARHKLYKDRSKIIYKSLKWFLDTFRKGLHQVLVPQFTKSLIRVTKFRLTFNIDLRMELFTIRNKLEVQYKVMEAKHADGKNNLLKAQKELRADPGNIDKYSLYRRLDWEVEKLDFNEYVAYKELANFEYFLVQYNYIVDHDEINHIYHKCRELCIVH